MMSLATSPLLMADAIEDRYRGKHLVFTAKYVFLSPSPNEETVLEEFMAFRGTRTRRNPRWSWWAYDTASVRSASVSPA
jgi:hypothetical protein